MGIGANQMIAVQLNKTATRKEILASPIRQVIAGTGIVFSISLLILAENAKWDLMLQLMVIAAGLIMTSYLAYKQVDRHYSLALAGWLTSLAAVLTATILVLRVPEPVLLYVLIAMLAVSTLGGVTGTAASILAASFIVWLPQTAGTPPVSLVHVCLAVAVGIFTALPGWLMTGSLASLIAWSVSVSEQAHLTLETARDQRLELKQV